MSLGRSLPLVVAGGLVAVGLAACGDGTDVTDASADTVAHVGELPALQTGRGPDGRPIGVAVDTPSTSSTSETPAVTGAAEPTDTTGPDGTEPAVTEPEETDPATTEPEASDPGATAPDTTAAASESAGGASADLDAVIGTAATGNRILALGDSITAAIGPEYGGQLCDALEARGWFLGVDAVQGRALDAGLDQLRDELEPIDWDAAIVNLGSNYRGDPVLHARQLRQVLTELRGMPVLLVTVTEFEPPIAEVNEVIGDVAEGRDDVWILDWAAVTSDDDTLTGGDGLHLSEPGRAALAELLAAAAGEAPAGDAEPGCELLRGTAPATGGADDSGDGGG